MSQSPHSDNQYAYTHSIKVRSTTKGTDLHLMRESNRLLILNCVRDCDGLSRAEVARSTNLSNTTVGTIVDSLIEEGLIREGASQRGRGSVGRRVIPLHFNARMGYIFGVAMGRNHVSIILSDLVANIVKSEEVPLATSEGPEVCLPLLVKTLRTFVSEQEVPWHKIVGVGLGMPGPLDASLQRLVAPPRMASWDNVPIRQILSEELSLPVYFDNNANLGALGESRYGIGRDVANLLYVKIGTGIGSGLIIDGHIYRGSSGSAGEIGHMSVDHRGLRCPCGNYGCLEVLAGSQAIVNSVHQQLPEITDMTELIKQALQGNRLCRQALEQAGEYIGIALASLINFFNPALIILDGSTMSAGEILLPAINSAVSLRSLSAPLSQTQIVPGALKGKAIALGCVASVIDAIFNAPVAIKI